MKIKSLLVSLLAVCSFSSSFGNTQRIEYLCKLSNQAEEARINVVIDIGHTLFKRYCPREHSLMEEYLRQIVQKYPGMSQSELEDQKQGALTVFSEKCINQPALVSFSVNLNRHLESLSSDLMDRAILFFDGQDPDLDLDKKNEIAILYFQRELTRTFNLDKILSGAHFDEEFYSPTYFDYLTVSKDLVAVKESVLNPKTVETTLSEQKVELTPKKEAQGQSKMGHCRTCNKNLRLIPFLCSGCEQEFCAAHHIPETHQCTFDFKARGHKKLRQELPQVEGKKLNRI